MFAMGKSIVDNLRAASYRETVRVHNEKTRIRR